MEKPSWPNHLQLVKKICEDEPNSSVLVHANKQLTFSFREIPELMFVRESDILEYGAFSTLLENIKPGWLFDMRITPRLDFLAPNRSLAFKFFGMMGMDYIDIFGTLGLDSYGTENSRPETWGHCVASVLSQSSEKGGPYMFIFDNDDILIRSKNVVPSVLERETNLTDLKVSIFRNEFA